jgi:hypothetical protein
VFFQIIPRRMERQERALSEAQPLLWEVGREQRAGRIAAAAHFDRGAGFCQPAALKIVLGDRGALAFVLGRECRKLNPRRRLCRLGCQLRRAKTKLTISIFEIEKAGLLPRCFPGLIFGKRSPF